MGSRGSVIPFFINKRNNGESELPITDMRMTRFNISLEAGVALVMYAIGHHLGGEIFIRFGQILCDSSFRVLQAQP